MKVLWKRRKNIHSLFNDLRKNDTLSICTWLKRWLKCGVKSPKIAISDQSLALISAIAQSFTQYNSLEEYLKIYFKLVKNSQVNGKDLYFVRNDINHKSVVQIGEDKDMECTEKRKTSTGTILNIEFNTNICLPCKNGDFPTGIHRCVFCNKSVHLFGCSVNLLDSKEGHRESRICLSCFNQSEENNAEERCSPDSLMSILACAAADKLEASTSAPNIDIINDMKQNYAGEML
ncbi:hypothetical protein ACI65C_003966 [Semiaphis heraclei]